MKLTDEMRQDYIARFARAKIQKGHYADVTAAVNRCQRNWARYEQVGRATGVPEWVIAAIHCLESSFNFGLHLHNGDPLTARTVRVPAGRPKAAPANGSAYSWEESAIDALEHDGARTRTDWSLGSALHYLEGYNGWGYRTAGRATVPPQTSPYLWSMTSEYESGKYVTDGRFEKSAVSAQVGACALLLGLIDRGLVRRADLGIGDAAPADVKWWHFSRDENGQPVLTGYDGSTPISQVRTNLVGDLVQLLVEHKGTAKTFVVSAVMPPKLDAEPTPMKPTSPLPARGECTLQRMGTTFFSETKWDGLERLRLVIEDDVFYVASGVRGRQNFRKPQDPRSVPGNLEPLPQGRYRIADISWAGGKDNYGASHGEGLGPVWVALDAEFSDDRGAFGFHLDSNVNSSPGSAGCVVFYDLPELRRFVAALRKHDPKVLVVDWGLT